MRVLIGVVAIGFGALRFAFLLGVRARSPKASNTVGDTVNVDRPEVGPIENVIEDFPEIARRSLHRSGVTHPVRGQRAIAHEVATAGDRKREQGGIMKTDHDMPRAKAEVTPTPRTTARSVELLDTKVDVKVALSGLWISMMLVFAYVDIFTFWRSDAINGALAGEVPGAGFTINQTFLVLTTIYVLIPILMVVVSLIAPARINRAANIIVSLVYAASVVVSAIGETWSYYIVGSVVEVVLLLAIARVAWRWPRRPARRWTTSTP